MARTFSPVTDRQRGNAIRNAITSFFGRFFKEKEVKQTTMVGYKDESPHIRRALMRSFGKGLSFDYFGTGDDTIRTIHDIKKLTEWNPVFTAIMNKIVKPVADIESMVILDSGADDRFIGLVQALNKMIIRTEWNQWKDYHIRQMLNEGGLSIEVVMNRARQIVGLEYRPHHSIRPIYGKNRRFADPRQAYNQVDISSGQVIATFPKWAIVEVNWQESSFHDRGVPYLASARKTLEAVGAMINGLVQKWIRAGGEIELYQLRDATRWEDVEDFKEINEEGLSPESDDLIRQIFAIGDFDVKRIHGDKLDGDARAIELLLEIIFMSAGIPKEVMGFKGHVVVRNMADLSVQSYYSLLHNVKKKIDRILKRAIDLQILLMFDRYHVLPEELPYKISGMDFLKDGVEFRIKRAEQIVNIILSVAQLFKDPAEIIKKLNVVFHKELADFNLQFDLTGLKEEIGEIQLNRSPGSQGKPRNEKGEV